MTASPLHPHLPASLSWRGNTSPWQPPLVCKLTHHFSVIPTTLQLSEEKKRSSSFQFSCMAFGSFLGLYLQTGAQETEVPVCFSYDKRSHPQPQLFWPTSALFFEESTDYQTLAAAGLVHGQGHSAGVCTSSPCIFPTAPSWLCSSQGGYGWHQDV